MNKRIWVVVGLIGFGVGYWFAPKGFKGQMSGSRGPSQEGADSAVTSVVVDQAQVNAELTRVLEEQRERVEIKALEGALGSTLGESETDQELKRLLLASRLSDEVEGSIEGYDAFEDARLESLRNHHGAEFTQSLQKAHGALKGDEFLTERTAIVLQLAQIAGNEAAVIETARREWTEHVIAESTPEGGVTEQMLPVVSAYKAFLDVTPESTDAIKGTLDLMRVQPNASVRQAVVDQFVDTHADHRDELLAQLSEVGFVPESGDRE